ncbi:MFS transporter [Peribacillus tepidiphilus]|uniref:MFS transporter n=1 Tax=Peribacillus tepidiphilus TaxID=2652445 RepID=UPI0035B53061
MSSLGSRHKVSKWCLVSMASIPLVMTLGNSMLIPILPKIEKILHISAFQSSLIITVYSIASIFLIPVAGYLSDQFGRKKIMVPSLLLVIIGGFISSFAAWRLSEPFTVILIGRVIQGIGAAGAAPIVLPLVGDLYSNEEEASYCLGIIETSNTFGKVLSPILGSLLFSLIWFFPFFSISIFSLISLFMVVKFIKTPTQKESSLPFKAFFSKTKEILIREWRWLLVIFIIGIYLMFVLFAVLFYFSKILEEQYHYEGIIKGFILAVPLLFLCIASLLSGRKIKDSAKKMKAIIMIGLFLISISSAFLWKADQFFLQLLLLSIAGVGFGSLLPALDALITEFIEKEERGIITSFYSSARFIGVAVGPPMMSIAITKSFDLIFLLFGVMGIILLLSSLLWIKVQT